MCLKKTVTYRKLKNLDPNLVQQTVQSSDLNSLSPTDCNLDTLVNHFNSEMTAIQDSIAPLQTKTISSRPESFWFTADVRSAKQDRRKAERKWRKTRLEIHREVYMEKKLQVTNLIKEAKTRYYKNKIEENKGDSKRLFQVINSLTGKQKPAALPSHDDESVLANKFGEFLLQKIELIQKNIPQVTLDSTITEIHEVSETLTYFNPITRNDVRDLITQSNNNSCSLDPKPPTMMKMALDDLIPWIEAIVNRSLQE